MGLVSIDENILLKQRHTKNKKRITDQMKVSFEILEARLMHEINQLKAMISNLVPNNVANSQYTAHTHPTPHHQPIFQQSIYPINVNNYEQTTYGSPKSNQPTSDIFQQTNIPKMQHPTSTNNPLRIKTTPNTVIEKPTTTASTSTAPTIFKNVSQVSELKAPTTPANSVKEKILEFRPVQTKSLNRLKSRHHK